MNKPKLYFCFARPNKRDMQKYIYGLLLNDDDLMKGHKFVDDVAVCKAVDKRQAKKIFSRLYSDIQDDEVFQITGNFNDYGIKILTDY